MRSSRAGARRDGENSWCAIAGQEVNARDRQALVLIHHGGDREIGSPLQQDCIAVGFAGAFELRDRLLKANHLPTRGQHGLECTRFTGHRSISPKTISSEPRTADTSASMWPRVMKSIAARCGYDGARILQRYGLFEPSDTRYTPNSPFAASTAAYTSPAGTW